MLIEAELTEEKLLATLLELLGDRARMQAMSERAHTLAFPDASRRIGEMVRSIAR